MFCFSDGVDKICLLSSIVDCDSKGFRRFSIQCFGSLLNVATVSVREDNKLLLLLMFPFDGCVPCLLHVKYMVFKVEVDDKSSFGSS